MQGLCNSDLHGANLLRLLGELLCACLDCCVRSVGLDVSHGCWLSEDEIKLSEAEIEG